MPLRFPTVALSVLSVAIPAATASAGSPDITYSYIGAIASISDEMGILQGAFAPGDPLGVLARIAVDTPNTSFDPVWGAYESASTPPRHTLTLPGLSLSAPTLSVAVANDLESPPGSGQVLDLFRLESTFDTIAMGRHMAFFVQILFIDDVGGGSAFGSTALPLVTPDPSSFGVAQFILTGGVVGESGQFTIFGTISSVPTPGALALCALTLTMWASRRRRPELRGQ